MSDGLRTATKAIGALRTLRIVQTISDGPKRNVVCILIRRKAHWSEISEVRIAFRFIQLPQQVFRDLGKARHGRCCCHHHQCGYHKGTHSRSLLKAYPPVSRSNSTLRPLIVVATQRLGCPMASFGPFP